MTWHARVPAWVLRHYPDPMVRAAVLELYLHAKPDGTVRMSQRQFRERLRTGPVQVVDICRQILDGPIELVSKGSGHRGTTYRVPVVVHSSKRPISATGAVALRPISATAPVAVTEEHSPGPHRGAPASASVVHSPADDGTGVCTLCQLPITNQRHERRSTA